MKLTACLIVKNEESCLDKALLSLQGVDDIIICDTGSTDNTINIAKKHTNKIYTDYKWNDNFAEARNHALNKCPLNTWVLSFDADDVLITPINKIKEYIEKAEKNNHKLINVIFDSVTAKHKFPTLFKNDGVLTWKGAAHNYISGNATTLDSDIIIKRGTSPTHKKNPDRTLNILLKEVTKNPTLARETFYLAREYWYKKDYETAIYYYDKYLKLAWWKPEIAEAYLMKSRCLWHLQRGQEARNTCLKAIQTNPDFKEALFFMGEMHYEPMKSQWFKYANISTNQEVLFVRNVNIKTYDLNVFINCSIDFETDIKVLNQCLNSFHNIFKTPYQNLNIFIDPNPNKNDLDLYLNELKKITNNVYVTESLVDGYKQSVELSDSDYCFQLEFDWVFNENIKHSIIEIMNLMHKNNLNHFRFNKRNNIVAGWDKSLKEHKDVINYCESNNISNNPHIINRQNYLEIVKDFDYNIKGSKGIEEVLNKKNYKSYIYGGLNYPNTITHIRNRNN
jgi:tetratricopeptide (TPR) repeat protein